MRKYSVCFTNEDDAVRNAIDTNGRLLVNETIRRTYLDDMAVYFGISDQGQAGDGPASVAGANVQSLEGISIVIDRFLQSYFFQRFRLHEPDGDSHSADKRDKQRDDPADRAEVDKSIIIPVNEATGSRYPRHAEPRNQEYLDDIQDEHKRIFR